MNGFRCLNSCFSRMTYWELLAILIDGPGREMVTGCRCKTLISRLLLVTGSILTPRLQLNRTSDRNEKGRDEDIIAYHLQPTGASRWFSLDAVQAPRLAGMNWNDGEFGQSVLLASDIPSVSDCDLRRFFLNQIIFCWRLEREIFD